MSPPLKVVTPVNFTTEPRLSCHPTRRACGARMISAEGSTLSIDFAAFACLPVCHAQPCCLAPETPRRRRPLETALSPEQGARDARQMKTRAASFSNLSRPGASEATTGAILKNARQSRPLTALLEYTELQSSAQSPITPEQAAVDRVREICGTDTFGPTEAELLAIHIGNQEPQHACHLLVCQFLTSAGASQNEPDAAKGSRQALP